MPRIARVGDMHKGICGHGLPCCPHKVQGIIIEGSPDVYSGGSPVARLNDNVKHNCPHCGTGYIITGSSTVLTNGLPTARLGDTVKYKGGTGNIVEGYDKTIVGG